MSNNPIGIFDSGVGGLTIYKEIHELLPHENIIYLADSKNAPYGEKSREEIIRLSVKNTEFLLSRGCKLIVVACNTASTNAVKYLREHYEVPFIRVQPAIKPAALNSRTKVVGMLATKSTLESELLYETSQRFAQGVKVVNQVGEGLVWLIEHGEIKVLLADSSKYGRRGSAGFLPMSKIDMLICDKGLSADVYKQLKSKMKVTLV